MKSNKTMRVSVTTMEADLSAISIEPDWTGRQLFDTVCRIIGLREIWYFGLQYTNKKGIPSWLQLDKKIVGQDVAKDDDGSMQFLFVVKFYPESVDEELIQDITRHLFFLQIKQTIVSMDLYCPPEAAILLASYAAQAAYGDCSENVHLELDRLLPQAVIEQYDMSADMWHERIRKWWTNNHGLSQEDAEMEYLRVAQDLDMYGIHYYPIYNQKDTNLLLGVSAQGIGIYETSNRITPRPFFPWSEISNVSFRNKLFTICVMDKSKIKFRAQETSINMSILDLCIGTHNLYLRRRQSDSLEVQQMKIQAREQRQKRLSEQAILHRERERRMQAEAERDRLRAEVALLTQKLADLQGISKSSCDENRNAIPERARLPDREVPDPSKRASQPEADLLRLKSALQDKDRINREKMFRSQMIIHGMDKDSWEPPKPHYQSTNMVHQLRHSENGFHLPTSDAYNGYSTTTTVVNSAQPLFTSSNTPSSQNLPYSVQPTNTSVMPAYQSQVAFNGHLADNRIHAVVPQSSQVFNADMEELRAKNDRTRHAKLN
ncbi:CBR-NFM-1 protein [Aphelenchoides avenae]|nr:CBR-NFM-1 protein [Aphelenchus avenae]